MLRLLRKLYAHWLAYWIERSYSHPDYNANEPFLCGIILTKFRSPLRFFVIDHINRILGEGDALRYHLDRAVGGNLPSSWHQREVYHRRFWILKCKHLRQGNLDWGKVVDLEEMNMLDLKEKAPVKNYSGPYGNYPAGSIGAVMNALSEQEGIPLWRIDDYVFGDGKIMHRYGGALAGNFVWDAEGNVSFTWVNAKTA